MPDLKDALKPLDSLRPIDRWADVLERQPRRVPEPPRSRAGVYLLGVGALALVIAVAVALIPLGDAGHRVGDDAAATPPSWLVDKAYEFAYASGDISPSSAEWTVGGLDEVGPAVGVDHGDPSVREYLVVLTGGFTGYWAKVPAEEALPTGDTVSFAVDPSTHEVTDSSIGRMENDVLDTITGLRRFELPPRSAFFAYERGGWTVLEPPGWSHIEFMTGWGPGSVTGAIVSNTNSLAVAGGGNVPPQAAAKGFPADGVALAVTQVATFPSNALPVTLPLSIDDFAQGSTSAGDSTLDVAWIQEGDTRLAMTIRTGARASAADRAAIAEVVASLTFAEPAALPSRALPTVQHAEADPVPESVSADCPVVRGITEPSTSSGRPGDSVTVRGQIYYRSEEGRLAVFPNEDFQVWWNLQPSQWMDMAVEAEAFAKGQAIPTARNEDPTLLGDYRPNGTCSIAVPFVVPDVPPGTYPVGVIAATGEGSTTLYGSFDFTVAEESLSPCSLLTRGEVGDALQARVTDVRELTAEDFPIPPPEPIFACAYETGSRFGRLSVVVESMDRGDYVDRYVNRDPADTARVTDVGEDATFHGCADLAVYSGGRVLEIGIQYADCDALPRLVSLALTSLGRL